MERGAHKRRLTFTLFIERYVEKFFVDKAIMRTNGVGVLRGFFENKHKEKIFVHMPTAQFFLLHTLNPWIMALWEHMKLRGYFKLPLWGPDYTRAYHALSFMNDQNECMVTNLHVYQENMKITRRMVREALNLPK